MILAPKSPRSKNLVNAFASMESTRPGRNLAEWSSSKKMFITNPAVLSPSVSPEMMSRRSLWIMESFSRRFSGMISDNSIPRVCPLYVKVTSGGSLAFECTSAMLEPSCWEKCVKKVVAILRSSKPLSWRGSCRPGTYFSVPANEARSREITAFFVTRSASSFRVQRIDS